MLSTSYQHENGLERVIIDLVQVGTQEHAAGAKQLAFPVIRSVSPGRKDLKPFRNEVHSAIVAGLSNTELHYMSRTAPTERESAQFLVNVDLAFGDEITGGCSSMQFAPRKKDALTHRNKAAALLVPIIEHMLG